MTILIDEPFDYRGDGVRWCHMVSDASLEELHEFAAKLGLKRAWFQPCPPHPAPHYDLKGGMIDKAKRLGTEQVTRKEGLIRAFGRRKLALEGDTTEGGKPHED